MGNCSLKGAATANDPHSIKIMTNSGIVLEFGGPKSVREILSDFPGCAIFGQCGRHLSSPLLHHQQLQGGQFYYLLPQHIEEEDRGQPNKKSENATMDVINNLKNGSSAVEVLPQSQKGVWKVKLVIDTKHLEEILSEEVNTEALIEQMRVLAATSAASVTPKRTTMGRKHWGC